MTDHHLSLNREVSHGGVTRIYVYGLEPLGPNKGPQVGKKNPLKSLRIFPFQTLIKFYAD